ncbi:glycosyltransferase [bacterium]|nr:glycosyltransferase [bacterium]
MRVQSVQSYALTNSKVQSSSSVGVSKAPMATSNVVQLVFTGGAKNLKQLASITPENTGLGLPEASLGGEGVVGYEMPASFRKHEGVDARSFMPFWNYDNPKGGYKFIIHREADYPEGVKGLPDTMPAKAFYSADPGETLETVARKFGLKPSEISYVIQSKPNGVGPEAQSRYCLLEPTSVKGKITRLSDTVLGETQDVSYALFKISENNPKYNKLKGEPHYFIYTPDLAKAAKPYSYDCWGNVPFEAEIINSDGMRALAKAIHTQMNTDEFGHFNPASVVAHDRIAHTYGNHMANMSLHGESAVEGVKVHIIAHNTGRYYQGLTSDPFKMLSVVGDASDAEVLRGLPDFDILSKAKQFGIDNEVMLSPRERTVAWSVLEPYLRPFRDSAGTYNILKTGIAAAATNPENISTGTVSHTFDSEMKSHETPDAARHLTDDYASIETKSVLNGSTPANLRLDDPTADFGRGNNGLSAQKAGFTTFKYDGTNIEEVIVAREKNAKWFTSLIDGAHAQGQDALNRVFFNEGQLAEGQNVIGYLKAMQDGDKLIMGWGRPDEQKAYNITLEGFKQFLARKDIPLEEKLRFRVVTGAGKWDENAKDYKSIRRIISEIEAMDDGAYKGLVMHVDGFFPNRLVGCATYGMFTSRREMCGITPLECKTAGVPYAATRTGGPVDYTNPSNGFLTKEVVEGRPERYGLTWNHSMDEIDDARCARQAEQISDIFVEMLEEQKGDRKAYIAKCKKNIEELVDWHNNSEYNAGKSANRAYLEDILETHKAWDERPKNPLKRIAGEFGKFREKAEDILQTTAKTRPMKIVLSVLGAFAVGSGIYFIYKNRQAAKQEQKLDKAA